MNTDQNFKASGDSGLPPTHGRLMIILWLLIGASLGAALYNLADQWQEGQRAKQAKAEVNELFARLLPDAEQQVAGICQMQDQFKTELMLARMASETKDIKLPVYRATTKNLKTRMERVEQSLHRLNEVRIKASVHGSSPLDTKVIPIERQQVLAALERQLEECRQDLAAIENRVDDVAERWSQLVLKEAEAEKKVLEQRIQLVAAEARIQPETKLINNLEFGNLVLTEALLRSQSETERARAETRYQAALDALVRLQPPTPVAVVPVYQSVVRRHCEPVIYNSSRNVRWTGAYYCRPNVYRFGPYLVVNN